MRILRPEQAYAQQYFQYEEPLADTELEIERTLVRRTKEYKPNLDDFDDIYSLAEIDKDKERLAKQKEKEQKETHERALILEAILADQIENQIGLEKIVALSWLQIMTIVFLIQT